MKEKKGGEKEMKLTAEGQEYFGRLIDVGDPKLGEFEYVVREVLDWVDQNGDADVEEIIRRQRLYYGEYGKEVVATMTEEKLNIMEAENRKAFRYVFEHGYVTK